MTADGSGIKENKRIYRRGMSGVAAVMCMLVLSGSFGISVQAAPATLRAPSAVIYEQPGEESTQVGNLVQDGSFEYLGDVTAEDGSVWHAVATSTGVTGYIRGELEIEETGNAGGEQEAAGEPAAEETQQETPEETPRADAGQEQTEAGQQPGQPENTAGENGTEEVPGDVGEEGEAEENPGEEIPGDGQDVFGVRPMQNNRAKTYASGASGGKIKVTENNETGEAAGDIESRDGSGKIRKPDGTLILSFVLTVFFGAAAEFFRKRLNRAEWTSEGGGQPEFPENRNSGNKENERAEHFRARDDRKSERRRQKNRRRKNRKKNRKMKKEAIKAQKAAK